MRKEASANLNIDEGLKSKPTRKRLAEGHIELESLPGVDSSKEYTLYVQSADELQEFIVAAENGDEETVREYLEEK